MEKKLIGLRKKNNKREQGQREPQRDGRSVTRRADRGQGWGSGMVNAGGKTT